MQIHQLRNATMVLTLGKHRILVDPMMSKPGAFPGFKMFGGGRKSNPLVPLPSGAMDAMEQATAVLITHEHPDHIDPPALNWIKERKLPVWASNVDAPNLRSKGLNVVVMEEQTLEFPVEVIPGRHGHGIAGWLMGPVSGFYLAHPGEPSVYLTGDSVLTKSVTEAISRLKPDVIVAPAGSANFGLGKDILFSQEELVELTQLAPGQVVFNHLESLDHCLTTRDGLRALMTEQGLEQSIHIPQDGELLDFPLQTQTQHVSPQPQTARKPGFQKWLTAKFAGT
ncbi:MAG: MBL fold metallo-hydrolase [Deltaproteobacteria bacterium]|nr:MAG: MBL fold metallo-hydrolase [Deltaproteobacteria bacterium]